MTVLASGDGHFITGAGAARVKVRHIVRVDLDSEGRVAATTDKETREGCSMASDATPSRSRFPSPVSRALVSYLSWRGITSHGSSSSSANINQNQVLILIQHRINGFDIDISVATRVEDGNCAG